MYQLGIDIGTATVKLVLLKDTTIISTWEVAHHNRLSSALQRGITELSSYLDLQTNSQTNFLAVGITGADAEGIFQKLDGSAFLEEIPAIVEGTKFLAPSVRSIIEIGSQGSRFINQISQIPQFATNGHCAGGTGSFFEDQMSRLGLSIEDYSALVEKAESTILKK